MTITQADVDDFRRFCKGPATVKAVPAEYLRNAIELCDAYQEACRNLDEKGEDEKRMLAELCRMRDENHRLSRLIIHQPGSDPVAAAEAAFSEGWEEVNMRDRVVAAIDAYFKALRNEGREEPGGVRDALAHLSNNVPPGHSPFICGVTVDEMTPDELRHVIKYLVTRLNETIPVFRSSPK